MYDEQTLREWAYDPDRDFIDERDQDEDLTLGLVPATVLLPLIGDPLCPKAEYLLRCLNRTRCSRFCGATLTSWTKSA